MKFRVCFENKCTRIYQVLHFTSIVSNFCNYMKILLNGTKLDIHRLEQLLYKCL